MASEKPTRGLEDTGYERLMQEEALFESSPGPVEYQDIGLAFPPAYREKVMKKRATWTRLMSVLGRLLTLGLAAWGAVSLAWTAANSIDASRDVDCNCGNSIEEAISRGCKYDAMATSWLPPACRDDELADEFDHAGPGPDGEWGYYADQHGNVSYTLEEISMLASNEKDEGRGFWTTHEWHVAHCLFYWHKQSRALLFGKSAIEKSFSGEAHTKHCRDIFLSRRPLQEITTLSHVGLNSDIQSDAS